jgi:hypothetical protein
MFGIAVYPSIHCCLVVLLVFGMLQLDTCSAAGFTDMLKKQPSPSSASEYCSNNQHIHGRWIFNSQSTLRKKYYCCGYDAHDAYDPVNCAPMGKFERLYLVGKSERRTVNYSIPMGGHACACDYRGGTLKSLSDRERFEWVPDFCKLERFHGEQFCALLGPSKILFVGDSTMQQQAVTLMNHLLHSGGSCGGNITYGRNDFVVAPHGRLHMDWGDFIEKSEATIIILSLGTHYKDMDSYRKAWHLLEAKYHSLRDNLNLEKTTILIRTLNPAHVPHDRNATITEPLRSLPYIEKSDRNDIHGHYIQPIFDEISKQYARKLGFGIIDMSPLSYRIDAHPGVGAWGKDWLHYCSPGPLDLFNDILMTMMVNQELKV